MRLINVDTLELEEYFGSNLPEYAILSHTWGSEEVSLQEWTVVSQSRNPVDGLSAEFAAFLSQRKITAISPADRIKQRSGYHKIMMCCEQAARDGFRYAWVDTCCIDKTSSAELSEAINSMFQWYKSSGVCYALLSDVHTSPSNSHDARDSVIRKSRWFTRGWTLQEFLAPREVVFYDAQWKLISPKAELVELLSSITGIGANFIDGTNDVYTASIAQRMFWVSKRQTTRQEDIAYCLLGIFDVNMPLLYGEGEKAFFRLQEEIARSTEDHTYMSWGYQMPLDRDYHGIFASSPADFAGCGEVVHDPSKCSAGLVQMTNKGLQIRLSIRTDKYNSGRHFLAILGCCRHAELHLALPVDLDERLGDGVDVWRVPGGTPVPHHSWGVPTGWTEKDVTVFLKRLPSADFRRTQSSPMAVEIRGLSSEKGIPPIQLVEVLPPYVWMPSQVSRPLAPPHPWQASQSGRILMKIIPSSERRSATDFLIVVLDIKASKADGKDNEYQVSRIRPWVLQGDEVLWAGNPYNSLTETCYGSSGRSLQHGSLSDFGDEAELCGRRVSVEVSGGEPWIVNIIVTPSGNAIEK